MYHHIEGELVVLGPTRAVVEAAGVGYECRIPLSTYSALKGKEHKQLRLLTHLQVLEDDLRLYGFATEQERELFRITTSIPGVGPSIALAALASFDPGGFASVVNAGDSRALQRIKGVGPKLSERLIFELKDRASTLMAVVGGEGKAASPLSAVPIPVIADAEAALVELGFSRREAKAKVEDTITRLLSRAQEAARETGIQSPALTVEVIIQAALRSRG